MESRTSKRRILAAERRIKIVELRKQGMTYKEISRIVGVTPTRACRVVHDVLDEYARRTEEEVEELRRLEAARLDGMLQSLWPKATAGDLAAIDRVLKIMERRARLLGLDMPDKHHIEGELPTQIQIIPVMPHQDESGD